MTSRRTTLIAVGTGLVAAALVVPSGTSLAAASPAKAGAVQAAAALPPLAPGDWTGFRNKAAGGGWNQAETTIGPANAAALHVVRTYAGLDNVYAGQVGATGHGLFFTGLASTGIAAYDEATGAPRWSAPFGSQLVAVGDQAVFTATGGEGLPGSGAGGVAAYAAGTGTLLWKQSIPKVLRMAPPTLAGSRVLVAWNGQANTLAPAYVASYDIATGRKIWQKKLPYAASSDWPFVVSGVSAQDGVGVVTIAGGAVVAFDLSSGAQRWKFDVGGRFAALSQPRPVIRDGVVYLALSYAGGSSGLVRAVGLKSGARVWSRDFVGEPATGLAEADGVLYLAVDVEGMPTGTPDLYALTASTGDVRWSQVTGFDSVPPTIANGVLYLAPVQGSARLAMVAAANGATLGTVDLTYYDFAEAAVSHGRVYVYEGNGLTAVLSP
jgi:outer membrane protein assembly factor BamB